MNHLLFDDYFLSPRENLQVKYCYSSDNDADGPNHPEHGTLVGLQFIFDGINIPMSPKFFLNVLGFLRTFSKEFVESKQEDGLFCEYKNLPTQARSLSDVLFTFNHLVRDENGNPTFDATHSIAHLDSPDEPTVLISREIVRDTIKLINKSQPIFDKIAFEQPFAHYTRLMNLRN